MSATTMKCAYCRTERPSTDLKQGKIIFIDRKPGGKAFVNNKTNYYCADKPCHTYDQMAHEG